MFKIPLGANKFAHNCIRLCVANENNVPSLGIYDQQPPDCMLCRYLTSHAGTCRKSGNIMMSQELCFLERPPFSFSSQFLCQFYEQDAGAATFQTLLSVKKSHDCAYTLTHKHTTIYVNLAYWWEDDRPHLQQVYCHSATPLALCQTHTPKNVATVYFIACACNGLMV